MKRAWNPHRGGQYQHGGGRYPANSYLNVVVAPTMRRVVAEQVRMQRAFQTQSVNQLVCQAARAGIELTAEEARVLYRDLAA